MPPVSSVKLRPFGMRDQTGADREPAALVKYAL